MVTQLSGLPDYGIDAPGVVRRFMLLGAGLVVVGIVLRVLLGQSSPGLAAALSITAFVTAFWFLATAGLMVLGSKVLKLRFRDKLLDRLKLRGDEQVLDVGCGRGLLLIGVARRLTSGRAFGIDLWQTEDQSGNDPKQTL